MVPDPTQTSYVSADVMAEIARLRSALADAAEGMQEMLPYVPEYFRDKHDLGAYVRRAEDALRLVTP